jgi:hypothetical protein
MSADANLSSDLKSSRVRRTECKPLHAHSLKPHKKEFPAAGMDSRHPIESRTIPGFLMIDDNGLVRMDAKSSYHSECGLVKRRKG